VEIHQPKELQEPDSDNKRGRDLFVGIVIRAAVTLQKALPINEETFLGVSGSGYYDSRAYYLYGVLDEVLKLATAMLRWEGFLSDPDNSELEAALQKEHGPHMFRVTREGLMDEQHLSSRKLVELLCDLLLFESTNTQEHYRLFLTCELLDAYLGLQRDFVDFFSCRTSERRPLLFDELQNVAWLFSLTTLTCSLRMPFWRGSQTTLFLGLSASPRYTAY